MSLPLTELEAKIDYSFKNASLLEIALTHSSYANEHYVRESHSNERLEFLGDAVLGMEVAYLIYTKGSHLSEGEMTQVRAALVSSESLAKIARTIELARFLKLGIGADKSDLRENNTVIENAFEALIGAVFLDGGTCVVREMIGRFFNERAEDLIRGFQEDVAALDYKSRLQIVLQAKGPADIQYMPQCESGPDHNKRFCVAVLSEGEILGTGEGKTKKIAEKLAAKMALEGLKCT